MGVTAGRQLALEPGRRFLGRQEAVGQIVAWTAVELHPLAGLASDNPKAVLLDLVQPVFAGRRFRS